MDSDALLHHDVFRVSPPSPQDTLPVQYITTGYSFHDKLPWKGNNNNWPDEEFATLKYDIYKGDIFTLKSQVKLIKNLCVEIVFRLKENARN
jgi:hypothetical protein